MTNTTTSQLAANPETLSKVQVMLQDILQLETTDTIVPSAHLRDELGIDSMGMIDVIVGVEDTFNLKMRSDIDLLGQINTVEDVARMIDEMS